MRLRPSTTQPVKTSELQENAGGARRHTHGMKLDFYVQTLSRWLKSQTGATFCCHRFDQCYNTVGTICTLIKQETGRTRHQDRCYREPEVDPEDLGRSYNWWETSGIYEVDKSWEF